MTDYYYEEYSNTEMSELLTEKYNTKVVEKIEVKPKMMIIHFTDGASFTIETTDLKLLEKSE